MVAFEQVSLTQFYLKSQQELYPRFEPSQRKKKEVQAHTY